MRLLHLADIHLGMENYGRPDPDTGLNSRMADFLRCLDQAVDYAVEHRADLVLFAGDAYRSREPTPTQQRELAIRLRRLTKEGIPVLLLVGNHDLPPIPAKANALAIFEALEAPLVTVANRPEVYVINTNSGPLQVACLPALPRATLAPPEEQRNLEADEIRRNIEQKLSDILSQLSARLDPAHPSVLCAHFCVEGATLGSEIRLMAGPEPMLQLSSLSAAPYDYVALGHVHKYQDMNRGQQPPVIYPGSIERVDFGEAIEDKGFVWVELEKGSAQATFVPVAARPFIQIDAALASADPTGELLQAIERRDFHDAVVKITARMREDLPIDERRVRQALAEAYWVCPLAKEVENARTSRSSLNEQTADPLSALDEYLKTRHFSTERAQLLRQYAKTIWDELQQEATL